MVLSHKNWLRALGPGIMFAAAAVGVSHLVQSTRAGANYGLSLLVFVLLANITKYPAFRFATRYSQATGYSMLEGYRRQGRFALSLYALVTLATMFVVQAAVTVVTAGLAIATLDLKISPVWVSAGLILLCLLILRLGQFKWLETLTKLLVGVFSIATFAATFLALKELNSFNLLPDFLVAKTLGAEEWKAILFTCALIGWMPGPIDISIWQSLWFLAKEEEQGHKTSRRAAMLDFHIGYFGSIVLALCFVVMGAAVMHQRGITFVAGAGGFAAQVIQLYTQTLGPHAGIIVSISAFAVMFSTTLTVIDGFPRALAVMQARFRVAEVYTKRNDQDGAYWFWAVVLGLGALILLAFFMTNFKTFVDFATTTAFVTAPFLAGLNHRVMHSADIPHQDKPSGTMTLYSHTCTIFLSIFALFYLFVRFWA